MMEKDPPVESAIPSLLRVSCPRRGRVDETYVPPYPSFSARFSPELTRVVMAYIGIQHRETAPEAAISKMAGLVSAPGGADHVDYARYIDAQGCCNTVLIGYWSKPSQFDDWFSSPPWRSWWSSAERLHESHGYFLEVLRPEVRRYETLFSSLGRKEGVAHLCSHMSGPVREHGYWGSARERIPDAQTDTFEPSGRLTLDTAVDLSGRRIQVRPHDNVCLIRSGQDWSDACNPERDLYLRDMEPVLREAMDFLRDRGLDIGCYSCRYMDVVDSAGHVLQKRFGLAWFRGIEHMERWSESHPTHVAIFGTFMRLAEELQGNLQTRFYHEVSVVNAKDQYFEYLNCHPETGLMKAARLGC